MARRTNHQSLTKGKTGKTRLDQERRGEDSSADVAKTTAELPEAERTLSNDKEDRQKTQSRKISDHEVARCSGPDVSARSMSGMNKLVEEKTIKKSIEPNPTRALTLSKKQRGSRKTVSASAWWKKTGAGMFE